MSKGNQPERPGSSTLQVEKEKTKRLFMMLAVFTFLAIIGMVYVFRGSESGGTRKVDLDVKNLKMSFTIDKPIIEQVEQPTERYVSDDDRSVQFTTGEIQRSVVDQIPQFQTASPTSFTGKNLINRQVGYVLSVNNPSYWNVTYNPDGLYNSLLPINTVMAGDMTHVNVNIETTMPGINLQNYVQASLSNMMQLGMLMQWPEVSYDYDSNTAFLSYVNPLNNDRTYQKVIMKGNTAYVVTGNYNQSFSQQAYIDDLINMVATFTLLSS